MSRKPNPPFSFQASHKEWQLVKEEPTMAGSTGTEAFCPPPQIHML